jgi:hypothetical protein
MGSADITHVQSDAPAQRPSMARSLRATRRLATFAVARLRRRGLAILSASGAALSVAMLTAVLIVGAGVEDAAFNTTIAAHESGGLGPFQRANGIFVLAPIGKDAPAAQRFVNARLRRDGLSFQASAFVVLSQSQVIVMNDDLAENFSVVSGRLPRACVPALCEYAENAPGPGNLGIPVSGSPERPIVPGYRFVNVGRVHQRKASVIPVPPIRVAIVAGFSPISTRTGRSGNGALQWSAPAGNLARHPWDVSHALAAVTRLDSDLKQRLGEVRVDSQSTNFETARAQASSDGRRLLVVSGAVLGVFVAFMIFAACRLRHDAELLYERLTVVNATRRQIRAVSLFEFLLASVAGSAVGIVVGVAAGALLVHHLGGAGAATARHVLGLRTTWVYWSVALAISICSLYFVSRAVRAGARSRAPELAGAVALAVLVTGLTKGGLDPSQLGAAGGATIAFVVLVPTLLAIVVAVAGTRLLAPAFVGLERVTRTLGPPARLAALSIARRPGDAAVVVGFLGATLGLALFLLVYRATLVRSQHDQVLYAAPTDAVISEDLRQLVPVNNIPLARFPGKERIPVLRASGNVPQLENDDAFTLLGIPATALPGLSGWRRDFSDLSPAEITKRLRPSFDPQFRAIPLPRGRSRLVLPLQHDGEPLDVSATLLSRTGTFTEVEVGDTHEQSLHLTVPAEFRGGSLVGLVFRPGDTGLHQSAHAGDLFDDVAVGSLRIGPVPWIDFAGFDGVNGIDALAAGHTVTIRYAVGTKTVARLRTRQPTDGRFVNVVVSPQLARAAGARGVLPLDVLGTQVITRVVGVVSHFPTVDGNVVLADRRTVATALNASDPGPPFYNEVWVNDPDHVRLERQLTNPVIESMTVVERSNLVDHALLSPVIRGARDLLALAVLTAVILGLIGIALAVSSDVRARRWEILDLSAQGLDQKSLIRFARLRLLLSCGFAALLALVLGLALAFVTVRLIRIAADVEKPNPPLLTTVHWAALGGGAIAVLLAVVVLVNVLTAAQLRRLQGART